MKIQLTKSSLKSIQDHTVVVPLYQQGARPKLPKGAGYLKKLIDKVAKEKVFDASFKSLCYLRYVNAGRASSVLFVGLGNKKEITPGRFREAAIAGAAHLSGQGIPSFTYHLSSQECPSVCPTDECVRATAESLVLPLYTFSTFRKNAKPNSGIKSVTIAVESTKELRDGKRGLDKAKKVIDACNLVRDLVNTPSNELQTDQYAKLAQEAAKKVGLKTTVFKEKELERQGFRTLLAVNKGSDQPPRLVILEHNAGKKNLDTVCLVGKGITFDTGGISLKPPKAMEDMKIDMAGSATVLGIMLLAAQLKLPIHLVGVMAITDNMPSGKATVPGDIIKSYTGKTIEILNTDAEGRLILADALAYSDRTFNPKLLIDFATLTGACVMALGNAGAGILGTDQKSIDKLLKLQEYSCDKAWQLPMWDEFYEEMNSNNADIKNIGTTPGAGTAKGAVFLKAFIRDKTPWVHFDIAGSASIPKPTHRYYPAGATAACVRLVTEFLEGW